MGKNVNMEPYDNKYKNGQPLISCTVDNCTMCIQDDPKTWDHVTFSYPSTESHYNPHQTTLPNQACPVCGTWGYHNCLGYKQPTSQIQITTPVAPVDWNRAINIFDRLVTVLERYFEDKNG